MKILHLNAGNETGGGMHHILLLLNELPREEIVLGVFEEGELSKRAKALGIHTVIFKQESRKDFSIVKKIVAFIKEESIDIIHTHGARANLYGTFIVKKAKCKWITTVHSNPDDDFLGKGIKGKVFTAINKWSIKKADHLFAISERFKDMLIGYGINENKITTILNGIDYSVMPTKSYSRVDFKIAEEDFVMIMIARLEKVKDHVVALEALKKVVDTNEAMKLILVGEGEERALLEDKVKELKLVSNVSFLGHREDVIDLFPLADICLLTSKSESFPLVLLEAARASIPAITTNVGGVNLMIPSQAFGWIKNVSDVEGISDAIKEAEKLKDSNDLSQMGSEFGAHCKKLFSVANQANDIRGTYESMMEKK